jgi:hypothetical protein
MDWAVTAAILALANAAHRERGIAPDVTELFVRMIRHMPDGYCCYERPLLRCARALPDLPKDLKEFLDDVWRKRPLSPPS